MNLIIQAVTVVDLTNKEAKRIELVPSKNLITSDGNHYGKSVLMKSIYYSLGAEVYFPKPIKQLNFMTSVSFSIGKDSYSVTRLKNAFVLYKQNEYVGKYNSVGEFGEKLSEVFELSIELVGKDEQGTIIKCPPAIYYLPYYVDQENGWSNNSYSFNNMTQFDLPQRKDSFFFHFGVLDREYIDRKKQQKVNERQITKLEKEIEKYKTVIDTLKMGLDDVDMTFDSERLERVISNRTNEINDILKDLSNIRKKLIKEEDEYHRLLSEKEILGKYIKKKTPEVISERMIVECPRCGLFFEPAGVERIEKQYLIETLNDDYTKKAREIDLAENRIEKLKQKFSAQQSRLEEYEQSLEDNQNLYETYMKAKTTNKLLDDYYRIIESNRRKKDELLDSNSTIRKTLKDYGDDRNEANGVYLNKLTPQLMRLDIPMDQVEDNSEPGSRLMASGAYGPRCKIAQILSFAETKQELASEIITFPIVIDSPNVLEQDKKHLEIVLEELLHWNRTDNQIIVASIEGKEIALKMEGVKVLDITGETNHIMSKAEYQTIEEEITDIVTHF